MANNKNGSKPMKNGKFEFPVDAVRWTAKTEDGVTIIGFDTAIFAAKNGKISQIGPLDEKLENLKDVKYYNNVKHDAVSLGEDFLAHHGIKGQKWGVRNGPPYPLGSGDHSAAEKRAASGGNRSTNNTEHTRSSSKTNEHKSDAAAEKSGLSPKAKAMIGVAAGIALLAAGAYVYDKYLENQTAMKIASFDIGADSLIDTLNRQQAEIDENLNKALFRMNAVLSGGESEDESGEIIEFPKDKTIEGTMAALPKIGRPDPRDASEELAQLEDDLKKVNDTSGFLKDSNGFMIQTNCTSCSAASIGRIFGYDVKASRDQNTILSWNQFEKLLQKPLESLGLDSKLKGLTNYHAGTVADKNTRVELFNALTKNSGSGGCGFLNVYAHSGGVSVRDITAGTNHSIFYRILSDGRLYIGDAQNKCGVIIDPRGSCKEIFGGGVKPSTWMKSVSVGMSTHASISKSEFEHIANMIPEDDNYPYLFKANIPWVESAVEEIVDKLKHSGMEEKPTKNNELVLWWADHPKGGKILGFPEGICWVKSLKTKEVEWLNPTDPALKGIKVTYNKDIFGDMPLKHATVSLGEDFLAHHGIKGQKWGVRNGPPYPLGSGDHSAAEKRAAGGGRSHKAPEQGKEGIAAETVFLIAEVAVTVAPFVAVAVSTAVKKSKNDSLAKQGYRTLKKDEKPAKITGPHSAEDDAKAVNGEKGAAEMGRGMNCVLCSAAWCMRREGYDVVAGESNTGKNGKEQEAFYNSSKTKTIAGNEYDPNPSDPNSYYRKEYANWLTGQPLTKSDLDKWASSLKSEYKPGARGTMLVYTSAFMGGHSIAWEIDKNGNVVIVDPQVGKVVYNQGGSVSPGADDWMRMISNSRCVTREVSTSNINMDYVESTNAIWTKGGEGETYRHNYNDTTRDDNASEEYGDRYYEEQERLRHDSIGLGEDFLAHHGIKGQKWGVRNGPPYPLGSEDKSAAERAGGSVKKSLDRTRAKVEKSKAERESKKNPPEEPKKVWTKEEVLKSEDPRVIYEHRDMLNNIELKRAIERLNNVETLKKQVDKLDEKQKSSLQRLLSNLKEDVVNHPGQYIKMVLSVLKMASSKDLVKNVEFLSKLVSGNVEMEAKFAANLKEVLAGQLYQTYKPWYGPEGDRYVIMKDIKAKTVWNELENKVNAADLLQKHNGNYEEAAKDFLHQYSEIPLTIDVDEHGKYSYSTDYNEKDVKYIMRKLKQKTK